VKEESLFPRVQDQHKPNKPLIPNGLGVIYVLVSVVYIFLIYSFDIVRVSNGVSPSLTLAVSILFGGFLGLLDDWIDLKWRLKAFLPLIAAIPLVSFAYRWGGARTMIALPFLGTVDFGLSFYCFIIIPILVTIITNTVNMLGGLNGLETVCPAIIMMGLMTVSGSNAILLICSMITWLILAFFNFRGKIFVGNSGSFAIGITLAAFAVISDRKFDLAISILPYVFNSSLILLTFFFYKKKANVSFDGEKLASDHRRSLITLITYHRPLTERQVVTIISLFVASSTAVALLLSQLLS
jgi:UDP-N-acetylmuramyl pentapeptide phosphotransferase/UDP-N-acetylglucosamine-1-phosphate transferase